MYRKHYFRQKNGAFVFWIAVWKLSEAIASISFKDRFLKRK